MIDRITHTHGVRDRYVIACTPELTKSNQMFELVYRILRVGIELEHSDPVDALCKKIELASGNMSRENAQRYLAVALRAKYASTQLI